MTLTSSHDSPTRPLLYDRRSESRLPRSRTTARPEISTSRGPSRRRRGAASTRGRRARGSTRIGGSWRGGRAGAGSSTPQRGGERQAGSSTASGGHEQAAARRSQLLGVALGCRALQHAAAKGRAAGRQRHRIRRPRVGGGTAQPAPGPWAQR